MARNEIYPWSLLVEVGDYFCVPAEFKPFQYMSQLVAQRNYRFVGAIKCSATKTNYGTIVMVAQISNEEPPYEFKSTDGILASTSRRHLIEARSQLNASLGEKPVVAKRTQKQIIDAMSWQVREANLPWWYDAQKGTLLVNPKLVKEPESTLWMNKKFNPGAETPYPAHYNLDPETLLIRDVVEEEEEDDSTPIFTDGEDDVDLEAE